MRAGGRTLPVAKSGLKQGRRCNAGREGTPVLTVVQEGSSGEEPGRPGSLIDEIVREGARRMLAEALQARWTPISRRLLLTGTKTAAAWWSAMAITSRGRC